MKERLLNKLEKSGGQFLVFHNGGYVWINSFDLRNDLYSNLKLIEYFIDNRNKLAVR